MSILENLQKIQSELPKEVSLVAVSKTKPVSNLMEAYAAGQRVFGENKIQEMASKWEEMPKDVEWHMIGHVQRNKVKYMAPFVSLIHAVDSVKLIKEIDKQASKYDRVIRCLLQIKIAEEESKFGMTVSDAEALLASEETKGLHHVNVVGLMGMATFTDNEQQLITEFQLLKNTFDTFQKDHPQLQVVSMGMSSDYQLAIENGSNMVRVGSAIFGTRNY